MKLTYRCVSPSRMFVPENSEVQDPMNLSRNHPMNLRCARFWFWASVLPLSTPQIDPALSPVGNNPRLRELSRAGFFLRQKCQKVLIFAFFARLADRRKFLSRLVISIGSAPRTSRKRHLGIFLKICKKIRPVDFKEWCTVWEKRNLWWCGISFWTALDACKCHHYSTNQIDILTFEAKVGRTQNFSRANSL